MILLSTVMVLRTIHVEPKSVLLNINGEEGGQGREEGEGRKGREGEMT